MGRIVRTSRQIHGLFASLIGTRLVRWLDPIPGRARLYAVENVNGVAERRMCGVVEHHDALDACSILDRAGHIDYLLQTSDGALRGIAARVQLARPDWTGWPFDTFTLRTHAASSNGVEVDHLRRAMTDPREGLLYPGYMIHAYVNHDATRVDSVGMVRTVDLIRYVDVPPPGERRSVAQPASHGKGFVAVPWDALNRSGIKVWRWPE